MPARLRPLSKTYARLAIFAARRVRGFRRQYPSVPAAPTPPGRRLSRGWKIRALFEIRRRLMLDVMYLAIGFGFLAVAVLYVLACDRL